MRRCEGRKITVEKKYICTHILTRCNNVNVGPRSYYKLGTIIYYDQFIFKLKTGYWRIQYRKIDIILILYKIIGVYPFIFSIVCPLSNWKLSSLINTPNIRIFIEKVVWIATGQSRLYTLSGITVVYLVVFTLLLSRKCLNRVLLLLRWQCVHDNSAICQRTL